MHTMLNGHSKDEYEEYETTYVELLVEIFLIGPNGHFHLGHVGDPPPPPKKILKLLSSKTILNHI